MPQSIHALSASIKRDPEYASFPQWKFQNSSSSKNETIWSFPKLDLDLLDSAFGGKKLFFIGDSSSFYTMRWLFKAMYLAEKSGEDLDELTTMWLTRAYRLLEGATAGLVDKEHFLFPRNKAEIGWRGIRGGSSGRPCDFDNFVNWDNVKQQRPDIIVAHHGLHLLHRGSKSDTLHLCRVHQFLNHETLFLERVLETAKAAGTKLLLFKTNNFVCLEHHFRRGELEPFLANDPSFFNGCRAKLLNMTQKPDDNPHNFTFTNGELDRYCREAAFADISIENHNKRMRRFVEKAKKLAPSGLTIDIYDDRSIQSCEYNPMGDGIHYPTLQLPRIRLLAHLINCLWKK